ncbi:hypothetical protein N2152v2_006781 [Parachlorella kessleri]
MVHITFFTLSSRLHVLGLLLLALLRLAIAAKNVDVNSATAFLNALHDNSVDQLTLTGNITLNATGWAPEDSVLLADGRNVVITTRGTPNFTLPAGPDFAGSFTLNFSHLWPVITVGNGSSLQFVNVFLTGSQSPYDPDVVFAANATRPSGLLLWPSLDAQPGSKVGLNNTFMQFWDPDCTPASMAQRAQQFNMAAGAGTSGVGAPPYDTTLYIWIFRSLVLPVLPVGGGQSLGPVTLQYEGIAAQCLPVNTAQGNSSSDAGSDGGGSSSPAWWVWLIVGVAALAAVALAGGLAGWMLGRRRAKRHAAIELQAPSTPFDSKLPSAELKLEPTPGSSGPGLESPPRTRTGPENTLQIRFGDLDQLELGGLIGKGGYGRVVEHSMPSAAGPEGGQGCLPWESVLGAVVSHPNIITTYRVRTVELRRGSPAPRPISGSSLGSYPEVVGPGGGLVSPSRAQLEGAGSGPGKASTEALPTAMSKPSTGEAAADAGCGVAGTPAKIVAWTTEGSKEATPSSPYAAGALQRVATGGSASSVLEQQQSVQHSSEGGSSLLPSSSDQVEGSLLGSAGRPRVAAVQESLYETWMVLEYCDKGSLADNIRARRFLSRRNGQPHLRAVLMCLADVARGMVHLHSQNIAHGDLKAANVLMKSREDGGKGFTCKIADLGLSRLLDKHNTLLTQTVGTLGYMPPEVMTQGRITKATDVYSFGMLMYELAACRLAFADQTAAQIFFSVVHQGDRPSLPEGLDLPPGYVQLMQRCWAASPEARPTFEEVRQEIEMLLGQPLH